MHCSTANFETKKIGRFFQFQPKTLQYPLIFISFFRQRQPSSGNPAFPDFLENSIPQTVTLMNRMYKKGPTISSSCSAGSNGTRVPGTGYKKKVIIYNLYLEQIRDFLKMDRKALANRQPESRNVYIFMGAQNAVRPFLPSWLEHCLALQIRGTESQLIRIKLKLHTENQNYLTFFVIQK